MFNSSFKPNNKTNILSGELSFNCIKNLFARDLGLISTNSFIAYSNTRRLDEIRLSKYRSILSLKQSVTWLNLDSVESRLLETEFKKIEEIKKLRLFSILFD